MVYYSFGKFSNFAWPHLHFLRKHLQLTVSNRKVQVGKDQGKAQSEKDSHSKN